MGAVYRVKDPKLGREVALKGMLGGAWSGEEARGRFMREARILAELSHQGIVPVHDVGLAEGSPYYVMDLVQGQPLSTALARAPLEQKLKVFSAVCEAVHHAHLKGVIHRDLKPGNVLVTAEGQPVVLDFGIARLAESDGSVQTMSGAVMGTPAYMAPEQALGKTQEIDVRTDVYALGVMLYELVTGKLPFVETETLALLKAVAEEEPRRPSTWVKRLAPDLEAVILKALQKDPQRRYDSARSLAEDLGRFLDGKPVAAHPDSTAYRVAKWARRNRSLAWSLGISASLFLTLGPWGVWSLKESRDRAIQDKERAQAAEKRALVDKTRAEAAERETQAKKMALQNQLDATVLQRKVAHLYTAGRPPAEILAVFREIIALTPDDMDANLLYAQFLRESGDKAGTLDLLDRLALKFPDSDRILTERAVALMALLRHEEALKDAQRAMQLAPNAHNAQCLIAVLNALGRYLEALKCSEEILARDTSNLNSVCAHAECLICCGREKEAAGLLDAFPVPGTREGLSRLLKIRCRAHLFLGDLKESSRICEMLLFLEPSDPETLGCHACLLLQRGDLDEAARVAQKSLDLSPTSFTIRTLATVLSARGKTAEALEHVDRQRRITPYDLTLLCMRGELLQSLGRLEEALEACDHALRRIPPGVEGVVHVHNRRGMLLFSLGRMPEALQAYDAALEIRPDFADALSNRGVLQAGRRLWAEALASLDAALKADPAHPQAPYYRGCVLQTLGRNPEAIEALESALKNPGLPVPMAEDARMRLGLLRKSP